MSGCGAVPRPHRQSLSLRLALYRLSQRKYRWIIGRAMELRMQQKERVE